MPAAAKMQAMKRKNIYSTFSADAGPTLGPRKKNMTKREITKLALIILGISIIIRMLLELSNSLILNPSDSYPAPTILGMLVIMFILVASGCLLIIKSGYFSKIIFKNDNNSKIEFSLKKQETIHLSIAILSIYFLVSLFSAFINNILDLITSITDGRSYFRNYIPRYILFILLYLLILLSLLKSKNLSKWIENRI
jgi:hypothetical protein